MALDKNNKVEIEKTVTKAIVARAVKLGETSKGGDIIGVDLIINGVTIYGAKLVEYQNKNGNIDYMLTFPQRKGSDGKYYDVCWCPISRETRHEIVADATKKLSEI